MSGRAWRGRDRVAGRRDPQRDHRHPLRPVRQADQPHARWGPLVSSRALAWAWAQNLPPNEKLVLVALADQANAEGACFPSRGYVARSTGFSLRTISEVASRLEGRGLIRREQRARKDGGSTSNLYHLHVSAPAEDFQ